MSMIMTLRANGDPNELERRAAGNPDAIRADKGLLRQANGPG